MISPVFRTLGALVLLLVTAGCSVQSMQADMVRSAMPSEDFEADDYAWVMRFNDTESIVYAVTVGDGTVFANRDGLQIGFDGWDPVLVTGMAGAMGDIKVHKPEDQQAGVREHDIAGIGTFRVECEEPERVDRGWRTDCRHRGEERVYPMTQRVDLAADGRITRIESHIVPGADPLVLTPLSD